jgi:hypothetical protein
MQKISKKYNSFAEAEQAEIKYWKELPGDKKLEILEQLRVQYWIITHAEKPGFQRIYRIIKQA